MKSNDQYDRDREEGERAALDTAASDWLIAHDRGLTLPEQRDFERWLAADRRHAEVWAEARRAWSRLDRLPEVRDRPGIDSPRRSVRWAAWTAAAAAAAIGFFLWPRTRPILAPAPSGLVRVVPRQLTLSDGSRVELNAASEVREEFTGAERRIRLVRGEAHFQVAKIPARPFIVETNGVDVRAVGTAFDVRIDAATVAVLVTEGKVRLDAPSVPPDPGLKRGDSQLLVAGQRAVIALAAPAAAPQVSAVSTDEIGRALAWQALRLQFQDMSLDQVAAEFNRHNRTQLVVADSAADILVAGTFRADNADVFVRFLEDGFHLRADRQVDGRIVLSAAP